MIIDLLILAAISVVIYFCVPFIADMLSLPFNAFSIGRLRNAQEFGIPYITKWYDLLLALVAFLVFSYLFSGICASYLAWISQRHPDEFWAKTIAVVFGSGVASSFSRSAGKLAQRDPLMGNTPSVLAAMFVKIAVYLICVLFLVFPKLLQYWSWMPYVS